MVNDNGLVDEFERLKKLEKETKEKLENIKREIIKLAQEKQANVLFGNHKKCSIKEFEKIVYPEDKENFVNLIKQKGLYDKFSSLNYFKIAPAVRKKEIDEEILGLIKLEKDFMVTLGKL